MTGVPSLKLDSGAGSGWFVRLGKTALGMGLSTTAIGFVEKSIPQTQGLGSIGSIGLGFLVAKFVDDDVGAGIALGGASDIMQGLLTQVGINS